MQVIVSRRLTHEGLTYLPGEHTVPKELGEALMATYPNRAWEAGETEAGPVAGVDLGEMTTMASSVVPSQIPMTAAAAELIYTNNLNAAWIKGTGSGGKILKRDVEAYLEVLD